MERLEFLINHAGFEADSVLLKPLFDYIERMKEVPACKKLLLESADHFKFYEQYLNNEEPDYDLGNK